MKTTLIKIFLIVALVIVLGMLAGAVNAGISGTYVPATTSNTTSNTIPWYAAVDGYDNLWFNEVGYPSLIRSRGNYENCPTITTTVAVPQGKYDVYVLFWKGPWGYETSLIRAALHGNSLANIYYDTSSVNTGVYSYGQVLGEVKIGTTASNVTSISVDIDDYGPNPPPNRIWNTYFTGISYVPIEVVYEIRDLGNPDWDYSYAFAINNSAQVVGNFNYNSHSFLWENDLMTDLGTFGGTDSYAYAINDNGAVVGSYYDSNGYQNAFLWKNNLMTDLGTFGGTDAYANGINSSGKVAGAYYINGSYHAFVWQNDSMIDLGTFGGTDSYANAINDIGQVVGYYYDNNGYAHAFRWQNGVMTDLGNLGGTDSYAYDINEAGKVVGYSTDSNDATHAFLWQNGLMTDLGTFGGTDSYANGINDNGQIVGDYYINGFYRAFLWQDGLMTDLGTLGGIESYSFACAINDDGHIVGYSTTETGSTNAVLWEPITASVRGNVELQDYDGNISGIAGIATITDGVNTESHNIVLDGESNYAFATALRGSCTVIFKCSHWLAKAMQVTVDTTGNGVVNFSIVNGDVVANNEVDFDDINTVRAAYGSFPGDGNWNGRADIDGSGEVDFTDINIVRSKYGEIGD